VRLLEVRRVIGLVDVGRDLVDAGKRVHHGEVVGRIFERLGVDLVLAGDAVVLVFVREPFLLDPGDVQHVELAEHALRDRCVRAPVRRFRGGRSARAREPQRLRTDEVLVGVELRERRGQRVDRAAVLQIAHDPDREVVESVVLADRVEIEEGL